MLPRTFINPPEHWVTEPRLPYSQAVRCGDMLLISGQVALNNDRSVIAPNDLVGQVKAAMADLLSVLDAASMTASDLVQIRAFYVTESNTDEDAVVSLIGGCLGDVIGPGPALTVVPVETLMSPTVRFEIEGIAMRGQNGEMLRRTAAWDPQWAGPPKPFSHAIRVGNMLFTSGVTARDRSGEMQCSGSLSGQSHVVLRRIDGLLRQLGADIRDTVKTNLFNAEPGNAADWAEPALIRASYYPEPGPAATGLCVRELADSEMMLVNDVVAMRAETGERMLRIHVWPDNHWDWTAHLPYRHGIQCGDLVFLGGQVPLNPDASVACIGDAAAQTGMAMEYIRRILDDLGMDFENVLRLNTFFAASAGESYDEAEYKANLHARFRHFHTPGPATTGIPVPYLAYEDMNIEIDVIASA